MYQAVRETDRMLNESRWPQLNLPEIYILEGGYSHFIEAYGDVAIDAGLVEVPHPELNRSVRGYTKMKERPPESYWAMLKKERAAAGLSQESLEKQRAELAAMYNSMFSYKKSKNTERYLI